MNPAIHDTTDAGYQRPRDPVEIWVARQWLDVLGFTVGIRENFFGVGGNSLDAARVINAVLAEFGVQLPLNVLTEHPTVERLAGVLREHAERLSGPLVAIQDGEGTRPTLFLVHAEDGQVGPYCRLAYALGEEYAVSGLQAPGLYSDAVPGLSVMAMADVYVEAVRAARPSGPYLLGGAGVGAAIAYEMAVRLDDVQFVAALPEPTDTVTGSDESPAESELAGILASWQERDLVPPGVAPEFVARSLRVWQANRDALGAWRPSPHTGSIDVFGRPPITGLPDTVLQRTHQCGTDGCLADALRDLIG